jgi:D-alanine transaminase
MNTVYLNGQFRPRAEATISVEDRGFIFGDGVYEVWRVVNGRLFEADRHLARLARGLRELRIDSTPATKGDGVQAIAERLLAENGLTEGEATLYMEVTRGAAPRTHHFPPAGTPPTVFAMTNRFVPPDDERARGVSAVIVQDVRWLRCDIKTVQLLPNVLAKQAAQEKGAMEAIFVRDGIVMEGSHSNLFGVIGGELRTHPTTNLILPGITRAVVLELARALGIPSREEAFTFAELPHVDELFLAGTTTDVTPVVRVDDLTIGSGKPGPISLRLLKELRTHIDASCAAVSA